MNDGRKFKNGVNSNQLIDEIVSHKFFNKFPISKSEIEKRAQINTSYLIKYSKFLNFANNQKILYQMEKEFQNWIDFLNNSTFHKSPELKHVYKNFLDLNQTLKNIIKTEVDILFFKLIQIVFKNIKLMKFKQLEKINNFLEENDGEFLSNNLTYTRNQLIDEIQFELNNWLVIVCFSYSIPLNIKNWDHLLFHFIFYLEDSQIIVSNSRYSKLENIYLQTVNYNFSVETPTKRDTTLLDFPYFYLQISLNEPLCFINNYLNSNYTYKGSLLYAPDYIFEVSEFIKSNKSYGYFENIKSDDISELSLEKGCENFLWLKNKPKNCLQKKKVKMNFNDPNVLPFLNILKKENSLKVKIDPQKLNEVIDVFCKVKFPGMNIDRNSSNSKLLYMLKLNSHVSNIKNKIFLTDILTLIHLKMLSIFILKSNTVHFHLNYDFRGRKYYKSLIGFTIFKLCRFFTNYGNYIDEDLKKVINTSLCTKAVTIIQPIIEKLNNYQLNLFKFFKEEKFLKFYFKNSNKWRDYKTYLLIHFFIGIGVINKSKILNDTNISKNGYSFSLENLFDLGVKEYLSYQIKGLDFKNFSDLEDYFKLKFYFESIKNGVNIYKKIPIGLDFSCSGHQIRFIFSEFKDEKSYELINLSGENKITDLYSCIISLYKEEVWKIYNKSLDELEFDFMNKKNKLLLQNLKKPQLEMFLNSFNRKLLKKSLMTSEYNATCITFIHYYKNELKKTKDTDFYESHREIFNLLLSSLRVFSKNLNKHSKFKSNKDMHIFLDEIKLKGYSLNFFDGFLINFGIFDRVNSEKRIYYNRKIGAKTIRHTSKPVLYSNTLNKEKTERSLMPNLIHGIDGSFIRMYVYYNKNFSGVLTVHDEYWIPFQEVFIFKDFINQIVKKDIFWNIHLNVKLEEIEKISLELHPFIDSRIKNMYSYNVIL